MRKITRPFRPLASKVCVVAAAALAISSLTSLETAAGAASVATGDSRSVHQPTLPAVCQPLAAGLATSNEQFSGGAEANPPTASPSAARPTRA